MKKEQQFHPLSMLPTLLTVSEGQLDSSREQLISMKAVEDKPHVLDDKIINRSLKLYNDQYEITRRLSRAMSAVERAIAK